MEPAADVNFPKRGRFTFFASLILVALAFCVGLSYFLENGWWARPETAGLKPSNFRVTSVSLRPPRKAIINGRPVSEGETLPVQTDSGMIDVTIERINSGTISLVAAGRHLEAPIDPSTTGRNSP
jgi:hypothetical protein